MTRSTKQWTRNTNGLRSNAQKKAAATAQRAEAAIALLIKEQHPINFITVAQTASISTAWLYGNQMIKERIVHLRSQQVPSAQIKISPREQASSSSKETMIAALRQRIQRLEQENHDLKRQVEVAYGLLHQQEGGQAGRGVAVPSHPQA
jgi:predicted RNase H-like nuclease (RuvC/YqgF family)